MTFGEQPVDVCDFEIEELSSIEAQFESRFGPCDTALSANAIRVYIAFVALDGVFDNSRVRAEGLPAPPRFTDYVARCVESARGTSIAEQMTHDVHKARRAFAVLSG